MNNLIIYVAVLLLIISGCTIQNGSRDDFNIVLITIDALRADHLSCYGYERETSPNIDKIAERGIIFKNAIAPSSWTAPSMVSLFTSVYPINHGVIHGLGNKKNKTTQTQEIFSLELITLPEILKANGFTTFAVTSNLHLSEHFGFSRGFDYFKCAPWAPANPVNNVLYLWEEEIKKSNKYFIWMHYFDPHFPYNARTPWIEKYTTEKLTKKLNLSNKSFRELWELIPEFKVNPQSLSNLVALYDSEINYVDSAIADLIEKFELTNNTLIIITSDHGQALVDHHRLGHGNSLYQETIHIPLIVKLPHSNKKKTINKHVNLIDIMPTILSVLDINPPDQSLGKPLLTWDFIVKGKEMLFGKEDAVYNFSELDANFILKTIVTPQWKYIYNYRNESEQLYNLKKDPLEGINLIDKKTKKGGELRDKLFNWVATSKIYPVKSQSFELSQEEKEKLEAMGYLQTPEESSLKKSQGKLLAERGKKVEEAAERSFQRTRIVESEHATIELVDKSENSIGINLINDIPVQGVQFTIEGLKITQIRTISRASSSVASFNKESGAIILMASSGGNIAPGKGIIAEITCDKIGAVNLSAIKVAK